MYDRDVKLRKAFVRANPQKTFIDERVAEMVKLTGGHEEVQGVQDFQLALYNAQVARRSASAPAWRDCAELPSATDYPLSHPR